MFFTVYITSFNYAKFLRAAIDSVLGQTYRDFELYLIDDGSTDQSPEIFAETVERGVGGIDIYLITNTERRGLRYCSNMVLAKARGQFILRLDADDMLDPNALLIFAHNLSLNPNAVLAVPSYTYITQEGKLNFIDLKNCELSSPVLDHCPPHGACTAIKTTALSEIGGYDESFEAQDGLELWLKIKPKGEVLFLPTPLFFYRQYANSLSKDRASMARARNMIYSDLTDLGVDDLSPVIILPIKVGYDFKYGQVFEVFNGKSLFDRALDRVREIFPESLIVISTDDVPAVTRNLGSARLDKLEIVARNEHLNAQGIDWKSIVLDAIDALDGKYAVNDHTVLVWINVNKPFWISEDLLTAYLKFKSGNYQLVLSTTRITGSIYRFVESTELVSKAHPFLDEELLDHVQDLRLDANCFKVSNLSCLCSSQLDSVSYVDVPEAHNLSVGRSLMSEWRHD